jgi:hypothetical protein
VPVDEESGCRSGGGRTGVEGEWVWVGEIFGGGENERVQSPILVLICVFKLKKKKKTRKTWHMPPHLRDYCRITKVVYVSLLETRRGKIPVM